MDHFAAENHPEPPLSYAVPPLCDTSEREIQTLDEFYNYPEVAGFIIGDGIKLNHTSPANAAAFMQYWMYFGLLSVFLHMQNMELDRSMFIRKTATNDNVITSSQLPILLDEWTRKERSRPDQGEAQATRLDTLKKVLRYVRHVLSVLVHQPVGEPVTKVIISIQALAYSITFTMKHRFPTPFLGFTPSFSPANAFLELLREAGWCPHDIRILRGNFYVDTQYYCTTITPPRQAMSHEACSESGCRAMNIKQATYRTRHTSSGCTCEFLNVPLEQLHAIVDRFKVPLIRYPAPSVNSSSRFLEVVERNDSEKNVAFSHVWVDGLGNVSSQNALPVCQLDRLQSIANMTYGSERSDSIPFYIDTLCVPKTITFRKKAIRKMMDVYKQAARVVVLDSDIESLSRTADNTAICVTIVFSSWMRRLWTYQEGALSKSLHFKFKDFILSFDALKEWGKRFLWDAAEIWRKPPTEWSVAETSLSYLQSTLEVLDLASIPRPLSLALLCDAFYWRSTSKPEDEAVVISTLIGQNPEAILEVDGAERLKMLLRNIGKVPAAITILSGDRMEENGYRWAPKSILGVNKFDDINPLRAWYSSLLRINLPPTSNFTNEHHVAEVLEAGVLHLIAPGFAILPQTANGALVSSPFWTVKLVGVDQDSNPVVSGFWRVAFMEDARGMPDPLAPNVFFLVAVEDPVEIFDSSLTRMSAFIAIPDQDTANHVQENFYQESPTGPLTCRFYCRVSLQYIPDLSIVELRPEWKSELLDESLCVHAQLARPIDNLEWFIL